MSTKITEILPWIFAILSVVAAVVKIIRDNLQLKSAEEEVDEAEKQAFQAIPEKIMERTRELAESQVDLEQRARAVAELVESSKDALRSGSLFNLYSKQIGEYQTQTQARAAWSFIFAIVAMVSGLGLVVWGGYEIIREQGVEWKHVAAGTAISAIGGAVSAFITKTFLDVHRLSLIQLNHYFRQPVLNAHILTAQRLADELPKGPARQKAYESIIAKVSQLITAQPVELMDIYGRPIDTRPATTSRGPRKQKKKADTALDKAS
jgi:TRADD-N domain-containing protein